MTQEDKDVIAEAFRSISTLRCKLESEYLDHTVPPAQSSAGRGRRCDACDAQIPSDREEALCIVCAIDGETLDRALNAFVRVEE